MCIVSRGCDCAERFFDRAAILPVLSSVTGPFRSLMGLTQVVVGFPVFLTTCGAGDPCCANKRCADIHEVAKMHLLHGAVNIYSGLAESVPILGNIYGLSRKYYFYQDKVADQTGNWFVVTGHEFRAMPYSDLVEKDLQFMCVHPTGSTAAQKVAIETSFREKLVAEKLRNPYPFAERIVEIAKVAIADTVLPV
jgi:hypothetical protein